MAIYNNKNSVPLPSNEADRCGILGISQDSQLFESTRADRESFLTTMSAQYNSSDAATGSLIPFPTYQRERAVKESPGFFGLPPELRNKVYFHLAEPGKQRSIRLNGKGAGYWAVAPFFSAALRLVSREYRREYEEEICLHTDIILKLYALRSGKPFGAGNYRPPLPRSFFNRSTLDSPIAHTQGSLELFKYVNAPGLSLVTKT